MLDHADVVQILELLDAAELVDFELETERFKLTLRRTAGGQWTQEHETYRTGHGRATAVPPSAAEPSITPSTQSSTEHPAQSGAEDIRAPLVGTFYRSPKPGAPPFVETGSHVTANTVVAIVETMKLMTSVHAGTSGRIVAILLEDGQFVEQDQSVMRILADAR